LSCAAFCGRFGSAAILAAGSDIRKLVSDHEHALEDIMRISGQKNRTIEAAATTPPNAASR
jgi:hypothetical protein